MDYLFSEEHKLLHSVIKKFVDKEIAPRKREIAEDKKILFGLWQKICHLGLINAVASDGDEGQCYSSVSLGIAAEEIAKGDVCLAATLVPNIGFCLILQHATEELRKEWLPAVVRGECLSCFAVSEPHCGTDIEAILTVARKEGMFYVINGSKVPVSWGIYANVSILLAKTGLEGDSNELSCFLLPIDIKGIVRSRVKGMGLGALGLAEFTLENARLRSEYLIGAEGQGKDILSGSLDLMRVLSALVSLGAAQSVMDETIEHVRQRVAFGKPIGKFEGVSFEIAEAATFLEAARALCYRALWLRDQGQNHTKESAMCNWWSTKVAVDGIHDFLLLHGHLGYSDEALIERRLRDVIGNQFATGSAGAMKLILVRELLGKEFLPYI